MTRSLYALPGDAEIAVRVIDAEGEVESPDAAGLAAACFFRSIPGSSIFLMEIGREQGNGCGG
ncbi:MAG: hypothetical protein R3C20_13485 [Planctomycetaceae bacterium]